MDRQEYVFVGSVAFVAGRELVLGNSMQFTPEELQNADACRLHFVSKADFDSIFEPSDSFLMAPTFCGEWPGSFHQKLERARDIVRSRRG